MAFDEEIRGDYLKLNAKVATWFDVIRILFSNDLSNRDFYERGSLRGKIENRWISFISLLLQKILLLFRKPVAAIGSAVEMLLNYPTFNGGWLRFILRILTGRVVVPDKSSAQFASILGLVDTRIELDTNIRPGDVKYNGSLAMMAAKIAYESEAYVENVVTNHWKMEFLEFNNYWNDYEQLDSTQAFMCYANPNLIVVAFRGTEPFNLDDWSSDVDLSWCTFQGEAYVHIGFMRALGLQKGDKWPKESPSRTDGKIFAYYAIREKLRTLILSDKGSNTKFIVTGHSLGGALAILFPSVLALHGEEDLLHRLEGVYTYGQPRVGNEQFGDYMKEKLTSYGVKYSRYVYCNDIVPRVPFDDKLFWFKHFGPCLYFNSFFYKGKVLEDEPNKNYFSLIYLVPKMLNAVWELIRSPILPLIKGKDYKETLLMKICRVFGLLFPGIINHFPVDYVNATRLGKLSTSAKIYDEELV